MLCIQSHVETFVLVVLQTTTGYPQETREYPDRINEIYQLWPQDTNAGQICLDVRLCGGLWPRSWMDCVQGEGGSIEYMNICV